jgi:hypothetical protein
MKVENEFCIEGETWSLEDGRCIVTPDGRFNLTYGTEKGSGRAMFPNFCKLDRIAQQVAALPELLAALQAASRALTELDPLADHHDAKIIDEALSKALGNV